MTLGYASTVHAAEGRTVDTSHAVFGRGTDLAGLLVPLTRGREANAAWVITTPLAADAETGETLDVRARTARAILADVVENAREELSALAERERAEVEARSTMTHVDQLIAVAEQVTTGRTSAALDRLAAVGQLSRRRSGRSWRLTTRSGRWSGCCAPRSWPDTTPTRCSPTRSPLASCTEPVP